MPFGVCSQFAFHPDHPLYLSHKQKLNSKLACPLHVGQPVPSEPPQLTKEKRISTPWKQRRNKFAAFFVANFVPWKQGSTADECVPYPLEPATLRAWMGHLRRVADAEADDGNDGNDGAVQSQRTIARGRLHALRQYANSLTIDVAQKHTLTQWRMHSRQMWDPKECEEISARKAKESNAAAADADDAIEEYRAANRSMQIDPERAQKFGKQEAFVERQLQMLGIEAVPTDQIRPGVYEQTGNGETDGVAGRAGDDIEVMASLSVSVAEVKERWKRIHSAAEQEREQHQREQQQQLEQQPQPQPQQQWHVQQQQQPEDIAELADITPEQYNAEVQEWEQQSANAKAAGSSRPSPPLSLEQRRIARAVVKTLLAMDQAKRRAASQGGPESGKRKGYLSEWDNDIIREQFPTLFLMNGPAGAGKTEVIKALERVLATMGLGSLALSAYTGSAVMQLENATTLLTMLSLGIECNYRSTDLEEPKDVESLRSVFAKYVDIESLRIFVIDECSLLSGPLLHHVNTRLQHLLDCKLPFGGLIVILAGDFHQKTTVGATTLHELLLERYLPEHPMPDVKTGEPMRKRKKKQKEKASSTHPELAAEAKGTEMFGLFRRFKLTKTHRFREDPVHGENLAAMRDGKVTDEFLASLQPCSAEERRNPRFRFATIGVVSNVERASLNSAQALAFARHYGRVLVRWKTQLSGKEAMRLGKAHTDELYQHEVGLWEYFVYDAPCVIEGQGNKAQVHGLVNGTPGRMHSLTLAEDSEDNLPELMERAGPGGIVTLSKPPAYINIVPKVAEKFLARLRIHSLLGPEATEVVIPVGVSVQAEEYKPTSLFAAMNCIGATVSVWKSVKADKADGGGSKEDASGAKKGARKKSTGLLVRPMALALAFAITDYKLCASHECLLPFV